MSINYSPRQVMDDSLTLFYDVGNVRSFKGKPTTNILTNPRSFDLWGKTYNTGSPPVVTSNVAISPYNLLTADQVSLPNDGSYPRLYQDWTPASTSSHTFSVWLKSVSVPCTCEIVAFRGSPWATAGIITATITQQWQRFTLTFNPLDTTSHQIYIGSHDTAKGSIFLIDSAQLEVGSYATPFVNGTRSNTQAILDLSNKLTLTPTANLFNTGGNVLFNGADTAIDFGTGNTFFPMHEFTMEAWVKSSGLGSGMVANGIMCITYGLGFMINATGNVWLHVHDGSAFNSLYSSANIHDNLYHHVVGMSDGYTGRIFIDGVQVNSGVQRWYGTTNWPTVGANIGRNMNNTTYFFNGEIPVAKLYKRTLSDEEVRQNFFALRGRFGV